MIRKENTHIKKPYKKDLTRYKIKKLEDNRGIKIKRLNISGTRFYAAYYYENTLTSGVELRVFGNRLYTDIDMLEADLKLYRVNKLGGPHGR